MPIWSNLTDVWSKAPMGSYMLNSVLIAGGSTLLAMLCGIPAAYALSRMKFKGQTVFLGFVIVSQMFAPVVLPDRYLQGHDVSAPDQQYFGADFYKCRI